MLTDADTYTGKTPGGVRQITGGATMSNVTTSTTPSTGISILDQIGIAIGNAGSVITDAWTKATANDIFPGYFQTDQAARTMQDRTGDPKDYPSTSTGKEKTVVPFWEAYQKELVVGGALIVVAGLAYLAVKD
jgi:hypothetical protein